MTESTHVIRQYFTYRDPIDHGTFEFIPLIYLHFLWLQLTNPGCAFQIRLRNQYYW